MGLVLTDGVVLDLARMKTIEIDLDNWCAHVGPGVSAFELQKAVSAKIYALMWLNLQP
jgi:FAD/FMN-containing dehydrogenase